MPFSGPVFLRSPRPQIANNASLVETGGRASTTLLVRALEDGTRMGRKVAQIQPYRAPGPHPQLRSLGWVDAKFAACVPRSSAFRRSGPGPEVAGACARSDSNTHISKFLEAGGVPRLQHGRFRPRRPSEGTSPRQPSMNPPAPPTTPFHRPRRLTIEVRFTECR